MALKPVTLRLDEEEYEKLKAHLSQFGDPDIGPAYQHEWRDCLHHESGVTVIIEESRDGPYGSDDRY